MEFKFPDSGKTVKIEGYNTGLHLIIRGLYDNLPGKPAEPIDPMEVFVGKSTNTPEFKEAMENYATEKKEYETALAAWQLKAGRARWAAVKQYYASCVREPDQKSVDDAVNSVAPFFDLRQKILDDYKELGVAFDEALMDAYIYLFHACISNSGEQTLFEDSLMAGTAPTQEAVQSTLFRFGRKV